MGETGKYLPNMGNPCGEIPLSMENYFGETYYNALRMQDELSRLHKPVKFGKVMSFAQEIKMKTYIVTLRDKTVVTVKNAISSTVTGNALYFSDKNSNTIITFNWTDVKYYQPQPVKPEEVLPAVSIAEVEVKEG